MTRPKPNVYNLRDQARRHNLKLQGSGRLTKHTIEAHERLICEAADRLLLLPAGETIVIEGNDDYVFIVVRSLETKAPRRCECCRDAAQSHIAAANRDKMSVALGAHKPSPPGRT